MTASTSQNSASVPATRRARLRQQTLDEIKSLARQQLAASGTGGLSLRGISRQMGMAPAALFRYFDTQSALITALCIDAFHELADAMAQAKLNAGADSQLSVRAVGAAYRAWALSHPGDFALVAGTPIPDYHAEPSDTGPAAVRPILIFGAAYLDAVGTGAAGPAVTELGPVAASPLLLELAHESTADPVITAVVLNAWSSLTGFLTSEIFGSLGQLVMDVDALFNDHLTTVMRGMGFPAA
ncbi:TetR/AcrR family transcriptional regulator [Mycobacteroides abscessus]|uniref:TetR/AcrR family transcriptional regulator n=1 Tax=Mycobacteroides abscessus TaxID=36809 RepID=UPI000C25BD4F|nr:TetR-like C-terminal domain-containing protein [Mycobacteroides abscessus]